MAKSGSLIAIVIGTKAELIKCMPLMIELQNQKRKYLFIHTGQHSLKNACEEFGIKRPDYVLSVAPEKNTKFWSKINKNSLSWFLGMIFKIRKVVNKTSPDYVVYHGDTMSTAAAAIGSSKALNPNKTWSSVHLEAGLRSGSLFEPFPEEISRKISDRFSDILLAVSDFTEHNLRREQKNRKKKIIQTGNTIVDSALITYNNAKKEYKKEKNKYALINVHRHENLRDIGRMRKIIGIVRGIGIRAIWPVHDNTAKFLRDYGLMKEIEKNKNIEMTPLKNYKNFIFLLANSEYLIADGGSIQEESLVFGKPCIILRKKTERPEGLGSGINFLTGLNVSRTKALIKDIEGGKLKFRGFENPYGKKGLSKNIIKILDGI